MMTICEFRDNFLKKCTRKAVTLYNDVAYCNRHLQEIRSPAIEEDHGDV